MTWLACVLMERESKYQREMWQASWWSVVLLAVIAVVLVVSLVKLWQIADALGA